MCVLSVHVCTHHMYAVPTKARRGCQMAQRLQGIVSLHVGAQK